MIADKVAAKNAPPALLTCSSLGVGPLEPIGSRESVSPSLHAIIEDLLLIVTPSKRGFTLAFVQVAVIVALALGFVRAERLPGGAARQKHRRND
jgi:hypothetical protein